MRVLVVEDDSRLSAQICAALEAAGFAVDKADDGEQGGFLGETEPYDAAVLDLGLPKREGGAVLRDWRRKGVKTPVLILTARDSWREKVEALDAGADDYLAKPFHTAELVARLRALIRRSSGWADPVLRAGDLEFATRTGEASLNGVAVTLTAQESRVLGYLLLNAGRVVSRVEIGEHVYGYESDPDSNTIEVFVGRLRRKLSADLIQTERGRGYIIRKTA